MGARLVSQVLARWTHVSDRAFRVLVRMALTALDEPNNGTPASVYFGGRDLLAMTLRRERGGDLDTAYKTVKRAIADLIARWRTNDSGQLAKVLGVPKPPAEMNGQVGLFEVTS